MQGGSNRPAPSSPEPGGSQARISSAQLTGRILIAEDDSINRLVATSMLAALGLTCDVAEDGHQALARLAETRYDLVLMDCQMPGMDGWEATRRYRELERGPRTPIVALTANALSHQVEEYLAAGMDGHVAKPIEIAKLYEAISRALNDAAQNAAAASAAAAA